MPTSENGDSTAGRVTRSLRKRITSIDSDASSRPGTPVRNNLQIISEAVTPSKRITRRTSLSTPITTPSKTTKAHFDSSEFSNSPARRSTRRRSVSIQEEELPIQVKSKEPSVNSVKEEDTAERTPDVKNRRVTRSSSKSPLELLTLQSRLDISKASAKNKSFEQENVVIVLDDSTEVLATTTTRNKKQTKVMIKKEKNIDEMIQASPSKQSQPNSAQKKNTSVHEGQNAETPSKPSSEEKSPQNHSQNKLRVSIERISPRKPLVEQRSSRNSESVEKQNPKSDLESSPTRTLTELETSNEDVKMKTLQSVQPVSSAKKKVSLSLQKTDLTTVAQLSPEKAQPGEGSSQKKKHRLENLKNVAFDETAEEDAIKSVFPRTPGLTKSKSYILDSSNDAEKETSNKSADDPRQSSIIDGEKKSDEQSENVNDEDNEVLNTKTPYKLKLKAVESSTPIQSATPKKNKSTVLEERKEESVKENEEADAVTAFSKSWSQSVSGTATEMVKIDSIKSEESMRKQLEEEEVIKQTSSFTSENRSTVKKKNNALDDSDDDDDDDLREEEDDYDEGIEEEEELGREKSIFVDDEAMEVPDGAESMDEEERQYLEENEVPVYGESIGSEDTDDDDYEEEAEEEDDGFIVSDSEDIVHVVDEYDSNDEIGRKEKESTKAKKYKRIMKCSESSNEQGHSAKPDANDFCLIFDSSPEQEKTEKEKLNFSKRDKLEKNNLEGESSSKVDANEITKEAMPIKRKSQIDKVDETGGETSMADSLNRRMSLKKSETEEKEETTNKRKSLKNKDVRNRTDETGDGSETLKTDSPKKHMSLKKSEDDDKEYTFNKRMSLKDEDTDGVEKIGDISGASKTDTSNRRMSLKKLEDDAKEGTPNKRNSLKNKEETNRVDKTGDASKTSKTDSAKKRMSFKKSEEDDKEDTFKRWISLENKEEADRVETTRDTSEPSKTDTSNRRMSLKMVEDDEKEYTPNKRKSLKNKEETNRVDKTGDTSEALEEITSNKRASLKKTEEKEKETKLDEEGGKETPEYPFHKAERVSETSRSFATETKGLSKRERKSMNNSKLYRFGQELVPGAGMKQGNISSNEDEEAQGACSTESLNERKSGDDLENHNQELISSIESPSRSSINDEHQDDNNIAISPKRKSIYTTLHHSEEERENIASTSKKESKKSLKRNSNGSEEGFQTSFRKSVKCNSESDQAENTDSPKTNKSISLKQARKSFNNTADGKNLKNMSRKSLDKSKADNNGEEGKEYRKENVNVSRKSLNDSKTGKRMSLIRTSTEEAANEEEEQQSLQNRSLNRSKLEKSSQSYQDGEETLSASEGMSLNSSRRSRKYSNRSKLSIANDEDDGVFEEQNYELELEETDFKKPHRRSAKQNISQRSDTESDEEKEENVPQDANTDDSVEACFSEAESDENHKTKAENTMMEMLGEELVDSRSPPLNSSRRKSINRSKLDETFELESKGQSASMHDSLQRSIMRKSLNKSQLNREAIEENKNATETEEDVANYSDDLVDSSAEETEEVIKKVLPERRLSVSLSNIEFKKKKLYGDEKAERNSFTIGVSVRKTPVTNKAPSSDSDESESDKQALSEQEDLEKVSNVHHVGPYKSRKSLSTSLKATSPKPEDIRKQNLVKRTSLYLEKQDASQSFVENITEEKKKAESKRKRQSNSFCEVIAPSAENEVEPEMPKSKIKQEQEQQFSGTEEKVKVQRILSRCDEILEAANLAKRQAKIIAKKSKVKKPKWMDKEVRTHQKEDEVRIPLVSRKEIKRKEKIKKELAKAIKHSTAMLKTIDPKFAKKLKASQISEAEQTDDNPSTSKRLPTEILDALEDVPKRKKSKDVETTPPSDKENSKKNRNKAAYINSDVLGDKKKRAVEILETASGTVIVEPSTPKKLRYQHGFRESPKTPAGFKIENIHSAGQKEKSRKHSKKLFTASGEFVEEDLFISNPKASSKREETHKRKRHIDEPVYSLSKFVEEDFSIPNPKAISKREKTHKRKRHIQEPLYSLPKTQWTPSGIFVEEDLYGARPLANSTTTQFMISSLNDGKKTKNAPSVVSLTTLNSALSFKQNALFNDKARRETSRELIQRKQRKFTNNQY